MEPLTHTGKATASGVWWGLCFVAATRAAAALLSASCSNTDPAYLHMQAPNYPWDRHLIKKQLKTGDHGYVKKTRASLVNAVRSSTACVPDQRESRQSLSPCVFSRSEEQQCTTRTLASQMESQGVDCSKFNYI